MAEKTESENNFQKDELKWPCKKDIRRTANLWTPIVHMGSIESHRDSIYGLKGSKESLGYSEFHCTFFMTTKVFFPFLFLPSFLPLNPSFSLQLHLQHREVPRLGVQRSCSSRPTPQAQQCQIQAVSATYTTAHGNARSLTPQSKSGGQTRILMDTISGS